MQRRIRLVTGRAQADWESDLESDGEAEAAGLIYTLVGTSLATQESVPAAFAVVAACPDDPWRACCMAASVGGDTDTIASMAGAMAGVSLGQRVSYDLAGDLFRHLQRLSLRFHSAKSVGDLIRRVLTDSGCISTIVKDALIPVLTSLISLVVMFIVL